MVVALESGEEVTTPSVTVCQFVAFGIKNVGLWGDLPFDSLSAHQAALRPSQPPSRVRGTLPFFDGFDVVDGPS